MCYFGNLQSSIITCPSLSSLSFLKRPSYVANSVSVILFNIVLRPKPRRTGRKVYSSLDRSSISWQSSSRLSCCNGVDPVATNITLDSLACSSLISSGLKFASTSTTASTGWYWSLTLLPSLSHTIWIAKFSTSAWLFHSLTAIFCCCNLSYRKFNFMVPNFVNT